MGILDQRFRRYAGRYLLQCILAALTILMVLAFIDVLTHAAIVAALGASTLIVFTTPCSNCSTPRRVVGGYVVGLTVGWLFHSFAQLSQGMFVAGSDQVARAISGALAVGMAILVMVATGTVHAPAAGVALGLVLNSWDYLTITYILAAVAWLAIARWVLKPVLIDLVMDGGGECPDAYRCPGIDASGLGYRPSDADAEMSS